MKNTQSLANQLGWCITTKNHLIELNGELAQVSKQYDEMVSNLRQRNYLSELLLQTQKMQQEFQKETNDLIKHIEREHLEYLDKQARGIKESLIFLN